MLDGVVASDVSCDRQLEHDEAKGLRALQPAKDLREAVRNVIDSNRKDGYPPNLFAGETKEGYADDLLGV